MSPSSWTIPWHVFCNLSEWMVLRWKNVSGFAASVVGMALALTVVYPLHAEPVITREQTVHDVAHVGGSYVLTSLGDVICTSIFSKSHKLGCIALAVVFAAGMGATKEIAIDSGESNRQHFRGYLGDAAGIGTAVGAVSISW